MKEEVCCAKFDPAPWDGKEIVLNNKLFVLETVPQILHIPIPGIFGKVMTKMSKQIDDARAKPENKDYLMLCYDPSPWKSELYVHVIKEVPNAKNVKLSGTFLTKVFDGPFNHVPRWIKEMDSYVAGKGKSVNKYYFYYTTCPKCAKKYGHNYVVVFAQTN